MGRVVPQGAIELPGLPTIFAAEESCRSHAGPQRLVVNRRLDNPNPIDRSVGVIRKGRSLGFRPLCGRIVGVVEVGAELSVGHRGVVGARARVAARILDNLPGKQAVDDAHPTSSLASEHKQTLFGADKQLRLRGFWSWSGAARDRLDHIELVLIGHRVVKRGSFIIDKQADMFAQATGLIQDPSAQIGVLVD